MQRRIAKIIGGALLLGAASLVSAQKADGFQYYVENGKVVITNDSARADTNPVRTAEKAYDLTMAGPPEKRVPYDRYFDRVAQEQGLPSDLLRAVARVESNFDARAVSPKGARGLMQLMPATAQQYGVRDSFDPLQNVSAGAKHLKSLLVEFDGSLELALAAYNAGSTAVRRHGGIPNYRETREYVKKVHAALGREADPKVRPKPRAKPVRMVTATDGTVLLTN